MEGLEKYCWKIKNGRISPAPFTYGGSDIYKIINLDRWIKEKYEEGDLEDKVRDLDFDLRKLKEEYEKLEVEVKCIKNENDKLKEKMNNIKEENKGLKKKLKEYRKSIWKRYENNWKNNWRNYWENNRRNSWKNNWKNGERKYY